MLVALEIMTEVNLYTLIIHPKNNLPNLPNNQDIQPHNTENCNELDIPHHRLSLSSSRYSIINIYIFNKRQMFDWLDVRPFYFYTLHELVDASIKM